MKPLGMRVMLDQNGTPHMRVTPSDRVTDRIWGAVRDAIADEWTPDRFKDEAREAWSQELEDAHKHAMDEWSKP